MYATMESLLVIDVPAYQSNFTSIVLQIRVKVKRKQHVFKVMTTLKKAFSHYSGYEMFKTL